MELINETTTRFARAKSLERSGCCTESRSHLDQRDRSSWLYDPDTRIVSLLLLMPLERGGGGAGIRNARDRNASATGRSVKSYRATTNR